MLKQQDFFLKNGELPKSADICWCIINDRKEVIKLSEPLYKLVKKPVSAIIKQSLSHCFATLDIKKINIKETQSSQKLHFVDDSGVAYQVDCIPLGDKQHWSLVFTRIDLDEDWLMELHPDYNAAIQSSDDWLQQIEAVINAKSDVVFKTAVHQALSLTHSKIGYLHIYDQKKHKILRTSWSDNAKKHFTILDDQEYLESSGVWAECIQTQQPTINNEPIVPTETHPPKLGYFPFENHMCVPIKYRNKIVGIVGVGNRDKPFTLVDAKSLGVFATILWHSVELPRTMNAVSKQSAIIKEQKERTALILVQLIGAISEALELKDAYTAGHQKSVAQLSYLMGEKLGLDADRLEGLKLGALIHDIGKLAIPSQILSKPSKLNQIEYEMVKLHPEQGALIVDEVMFPWPIQQMIMQHHERLDGSGYPKGLKGKQIILEARIIAVADVADSMLSHRPYRASQGLEALTEVLMDGRGKLYDADVVDACLDILAVHDLKTAEHVGSLPLDPVLFLEEDDTIEHCIAMLKKMKMDLAVVVSAKNKTPVGVIDKHILAYWHSPFLDTAAERAADRTLLNKRLHQIMDHKFHSVAENTLLKDAKLMMDKVKVDYLIVQNSDNQVIGALNLRILADALLRELDDERSMRS